MDEVLKEKILQKATKIDNIKKLSCSDAFKIASELNIPLKDIGDACNNLKIKIYACQLGCF